MKLLLPKILSRLAAALVVSSFLFSCNNTPEEKKKDAGKSEYPAEWMYNQRAYPDNYINPEAMKKAAAQSQQILASRSAKQGGDWTFIGPLNTGGRITDVAISPVNDDHLYVATAVGGIFRSYDKGANWTPIFDDIAKPSIGNIAIAPSNAQRIYVGTGEANGSATDGAYFGDGIYRSDDGGDTWTNVGLPDSNHIGRIVVDPTDPDRLFVAATGQLYGTNAERGIYRSTDAGTTWEKVLYISDSTAAIDVVLNTTNTDILYAAMWERTRLPWQRSYGGLTSAIHRSMDGGDTWSELGAAHGLPAPDDQTGRIGLAISESDPATVYARFTTNEITNEFDGLYKTSDNGDNWSLVTLGALNGIDANFGWYFGNVRVSPIDPEEVYVIGFELAKTTNSGGSWQTANGMHVDHHALEYSRANPDFILAGNDGGAYYSENGGSSWTKFLNLPITQFYNIEVDYSHPERLYGGTQDNNTIRTLTGSSGDWNPILGGDGFHVNVDPNDNNHVFAESQNGNLKRSTNGGSSFQNGTNGISGSDRNNWNTPVILSPFSPDKMYYGSNKLYTSTRAVSWTAISPDLTDGQHPSGSLSYGTLTAIAASYDNLETIYTGSDDGNVNVTFDGGTNWTNISAGLPDQYITSLAMIPGDDMTTYVTLSGFKTLDYVPHVFKTTDGGQNWTDISSNLPSIPVNDIITYPSEGLLFIATDMNVWYSENDGASWDILGNNLPFSNVMDLKLHQPTQTLYAGTFGRAMHSYDLSDILSVEDNLIAENSVSMYPNPANGQFTIEHSFSSEGNVEIFDATGKMVKTLFTGNFSKNQKLVVATEDLAAGVYMVKLKSGKQSVTKKIIIE